MILHIDMDAFFAAIEQRDHPGLKHKPVIVAGNSERSVVSTASYEARKFGICSAMPVFQAKKRCDHLIIIPGNMKKYRADSHKIMEILARFSPRVEQVSIDEAYLDISGCERLFGSSEDMARVIKKTIAEKLSLTSSVGIAPMKFLSKIASDMNKPDGLTVIRPFEVPDFLFTLPIRKVPGVGKTAMKQMEILQIRSLGDIKKYPLSILTQKFGKMGQRLFDLSNGIDCATIENNPVRKSISSEITLQRDISDFETIKEILLDRSERVGKELRAKHLLCETVFIKLKFSDFSQVTRSKTFDTAVCSSAAIFNEALALYQKIKLKKKIRLVGVSVTSLRNKGMPVQMQLIQEKKQSEKQWVSVDMAMDSILDKFGSGIIGKASLTPPCRKKEPHDPTHSDPD